MKVKSLKEFLSGVDKNTEIVIKISYADSGDEVAKVEDIFLQGNELVLCGYKDNDDEISHNGYNDNYGYDEDGSIAGNYRDY